MEGMPLSGIRVISCAFMWAGPYHTQLLADLGAEVIKIEHHLVRGSAKADGRLSPSWMGCFPDGDPGETPWNRGGVRNQLYRGKFSLVLDLNSAEGKQIFLDLVKVSDVVQDNYSTRAMPNFGLDYHVLNEVNPRIIMIRQPGFGTIGPYKDYTAGGCPTETHGGLPFFHGYHDGEPMRSDTCIVDPWSGINACTAVLVALWQRRRTGKGQFIDSGQCEVATTTVGDRVLGYQMGSERPPRIGNRHYHMAPHGCYPCRGEDKWIAIAVGSDEEWSALCRAMGSPSWTGQKRFGDQLCRSDNQDQLDRHIAKWTVQHDHIALMRMLQSLGVAAGAVLNQAELMSEPHFKERERWIEIDHPETGIRPYPTPPWKMSKTPQREWRRAPLLGEHNRYVLGDILGLPEQEIAKLEEDGIVSERPLA